jgi:hypothetical protein
MKRMLTSLTMFLCFFALVASTPALAEHGDFNKPNHDSNRHVGCDVKSLHFYMDTHDVKDGTFPAGLTPEQFEVFYAAYKNAMFDECVIPLRVHVSYEAGKAFCLTMAPDMASVKRAHAKVGLPYDSISEIFTATPGDTFFKAQ